MSEPRKVLCYNCARREGAVLTGAGVMVCPACLDALLDEAPKPEPPRVYVRHGAACRCSSCY